MSITTFGPVQSQHPTDYDPTLEAAERGIRIHHCADAPDAGRYDPETRTIAVRSSERTYYRSTATYQLAHAVLDEPTRDEAVAFAAARLIDEEDLAAMASVTDNRRLWARALGVRECLLLAHLARKMGLPLPAAA